jgi:hypothetical protein
LRFWVFENDVVTISRGRAFTLLSRLGLRVVQVILWKLLTTGITTSSRMTVMVDGVDEDGKDLWQDLQGCRIGAAE